MISIPRFAFWTFLVTCFSFFSLVASVNRDYNIPISDSEKSSIKFVVSTLSQGVPNTVVHSFKLLRIKSEILHVHPLRFLMTIFSDEEAKAQMKNLAKSDYCWKEFVKGVAESSKEEIEKDNIRPEHIQDFLETLEISQHFDKYHQFFKNQKWNEVVSHLMHDIPRKGNYRRNDY
jgi:L-rhamnose mutarotase